MKYSSVKKKKKKKASQKHSISCGSLRDGRETGNDHYHDVCFGENNSHDKWDN